MWRRTEYPEPNVAIIVTKDAAQGAIEGARDCLTCLAGQDSIARGEFRASLRRLSQRAGLVEGKGMSVLGSMSYPFRGCSWDAVRSEAKTYDEAKALEAPCQTPRRSDR